MIVFLTLLLAASQLLVTKGVVPISNFLPNNIIQPKAQAIFPRALSKVHNKSIIYFPFEFAELVQFAGLDEAGL